MYIFRHIFGIFYFQNDLHKIAINIEMPKEDDDICICFNNECDIMEFNNGIYSYKLNGDNRLFYEDVVDNIEIISKKPLKYDSISLFVSKDFKYFKSLEQKEIEFNSSRAYSINIPFQNNNKNIIQKASIYFEGIFYKWYLYIVFYVLFLIYVIKYKPNIKFNHILSIGVILLLAIILRLSHIDFISLWNDELYTLCHISDMGSALNLKNTFLDPGNPPLFFIISNIWLLFFNKSIILIRILPFIISIFGIYSIYFVIRKILNKKTALIASFLSSINLFMICEANEIRSYVLSMALLIWGLYYFYKLRNNFSYKNLIIYTLISILLVNIHYYCVLYVLFNFIFGVFLFKNKIKFLISNCFIGLSFLPYFILANKHALSEGFNSWIEKPDFSVLNNHIIFYFGNILFFILIVLFCAWIYKKLSRRQKTIFLYTNLSIAFVFVAAFMISILIKPILFERYFCIFLPFLIINTSIFLSLKLNPIILTLIFLLSVSMPEYENYNLFSNINFSLEYALEDNKNYSDWNIYYIIPDSIDYIKYFPEIDKNKVIVSNFGVREDVDLINYYLSKIPQKEKIILYSPEICINSRIKFSQNLNVKKIDTTFVPIYKIVLE